MLNSDEARACIQFLDRVQLTGHQERHAMNTIVNKLAPLVKDPADPADPPAPPPKKEEGTGDAATGD